MILNETYTLSNSVKIPKLGLGMIALPKTANPEHMKANADVNFNISGEDLNTLKNFEKIKDYGEYSFFPVFSGK